MEEPLPSHLQGVGNGEAMSLEEGRDHLINLGFPSEELTLAEGLCPGSVITIASLNQLARIPGITMTPDTVRIVVPLLQNLEILRFQVGLYLQTFGGAYVGDVAYGDEGHCWKPGSIRENPDRPHSLNASIVKVVLDPRNGLIRQIYQKHSPEIRCQTRGSFKPGPAVTARRIGETSVVTA